MSRRMVPVGLLNEPIVVAGTKYRIRDVLADSTPDRPALVRAYDRWTKRELVCEVVEYDPVPGVFCGRERLQNRLSEAELFRAHGIQVEEVR